MHRAPRAEAVQGFQAGDILAAVAQRRERRLRREPRGARRSARSNGGPRGCPEAEENRRAGRFGCPSRIQPLRITSAVLSAERLRCARSAVGRLLDTESRLASSATSKPSGSGRMKSAAIVATRVDSASCARGCAAVATTARGRPRAQAQAWCCSDSNDQHRAGAAAEVEHRATWSRGVGVGERDAQIELRKRSARRPPSVSRRLVAKRRGLTWSV